MLVALSFHPGDERVCLKLAGWIRELGPYPSHSVLLICDVRCGLSAAIRQELDGAGFDSIEQLTNQSIIDGWKVAPNFVFNLVARHIAATNNQPFLWLEPDVIPMSKNWLDALQTAYRLGNKPFMGDYVNVDNVPPHMSGIAIYPGDLIAAGAGDALIAGDIPWDVVSAAQVLPKLHKTNLIGHAWKHPPFNNQGEVDNLRAQHPEMVLFHADKSGSLIDLLRAELSGGVESRHATSGLWTQLPEKHTEMEPSEPGQSDKTVVSGSSAPPAQSFTCDIFIKTWPPDYPWLEYCIRSIEKFATGFRRTIVIYDLEKDVFAPFLGHSTAVIHPVSAQPDGYLWQQVVKLDADKYTDAPFILYMDSDTIFTRPVTPENYLTVFNGGKVIWMITPYDKVKTPWQPIVEKFLKRPVAFETMRRHPMVIPRWLLTELRAFCEREHGQPLDQYILSQPHRAFSEFNAIGAFAFQFFHDEFVWVNTEEIPPEEWPTLTVMQSWSRGGLTDEIKKVYDEILAAPVSAESPDRRSQSGMGHDPGDEAREDKTGVAVETHTRKRADTDSRGGKTDGGEVAHEVHALPPLRETPPSSRFTVPVRVSNDAAKWDRVGQLAEELKGYCDSPSATSRVRKSLVGVGILPPQVLGWLKQKPAKKKRT